MSIRSQREEAQMMDQNEYARRMHNLRMKIAEQNARARLARANLTRPTPTKTEAKAKARRRRQMERGILQVRDER